ncbi:MAG: glycosyltransferase [Terracoccus sp.]
MRILFASTAGAGHLGPLVPLARACLAAGHDVVVTAPSSFAGAVERSGLAHFPFDDVPGAVLGPIFARLPHLSTDEANRTVVREVFARHDAQAALPGVARAIDEWWPDLLVREPAEFGSLAAALRARVPAVEVAIGMGPPLAGLAAEVAQPLAELDALAGLDPGTVASAAAASPLLTSVPLSLDAAPGVDAAAAGPSATAPRQTWRYRDAPPPRAVGSLPPAWGDPDLDLVYVTFGSVTGGLEPFAGVFGSALQALADAPVRVLMTTASPSVADRLRPWPSNAHVETWWPQVEVMSHAAAVVGHGGFGTTMTALAAGVPQVVLPLFAADQFVHADHVDAVGAGVRLDGGPAAPALAPALAAAVGAVLADPGFRRRAGAVAAEIAALPDPADLVPVLEDLAGH